MAGQESVHAVYLTEDPAGSRILLDEAKWAATWTRFRDPLARTGAVRWPTEILNHHRTGAANGPTEGLTCW